jgi:PHD/YefM family antitoxin component YafN of YafNO toxin-antitoxin module
MSVQIITDHNGETTGVFIPIEEWKTLQEKLNLLELDIPEWHKEIVQERLQEYEANPEIAQNLVEAMEEIKKSSNV